MTSIEEAYISLTLAAQFVIAIYPCILIWWACAVKLKAQGGYAGLEY